MADRVSQIQARVANRAAVGPGRPARTNGGTTAPAGRGGLSPNRPAPAGPIGIGPGRSAPPGPGVPIAPTPSPTPPPAARPWNAQEELSRGTAEKNYGDKLANLTSQKVISQQNFGIDPGFNDYANNPYSRAALLRKSYEANSRGDTNSFAARGQLYAGSLANAQEADQGNYNQGYDALSKENLANLGGIDQEKARAKEAESNEINEARWRALEAAQNEPIEPLPVAASALGGARSNTGKPGGSYGKFSFFPNPGALPNAKPKVNVNSRAKEKISQGRRAR